MKYKCSTMWIFGIILPLLVFFITLFIGRYPIPIKDLFSLFFFKNNVSVDVYNIFWGIRLPRAVLALFCGGALSVSGTVFQGIFRNPLASPDLIGVSSGASFGAAVAIVLFNAIPFITQIFAFIFGIITVLIIFRFATFSRIKGITGIILCGIILNALSQSGITFLKYIADPSRQLPALEYWLMGSLNTANWEKVAIFLPVCIFLVSTIIILRWQINLLSMGDEEASALGVKVKIVRMLLIGAATIIVALIVSMVGIIGWIALVAPHATRLIFGDNNQIIVPLSFSVGAALLLIADTAARSISTMELPISIITALLGAPFLAFVLFRKGVQTWK